MEAKDDDSKWGQDQLELEAIAVSYGYAADAISAGDVEKGRRSIKACFTDDSVFEAYLPSVDPNAPPVSVSLGPNGWTESAIKTFVGMGYIATQHHIGNIWIRTQGDTAIMKCCVTALHVIDWNRTVDLVTATYTDQAVRTSNGWRIARRRLDATSFLRLQSPAVSASLPAHEPGAEDTRPKNTASMSGQSARAQGPHERGPESAMAAISLLDRMELEALCASYAFAADAVSSGAVAEGRRLIETCFTPDAVFDVYLPNRDPEGPPGSRAIGPGAWRDAVAALPYRGAQHHTGDVQIDVQGDTAIMKSRLTSTLIHEWNRSIDLCTGIYTDRVVRTPDGWRIAHRRFHATSFLRLESPPPGGNEQQMDTMTSQALGAAVPAAVAREPLRQSPLMAGSQGPSKGSLAGVLSAWKNQQEIGALAVAYAHAADALGRGDVEEGRRIITTCFTNDTVFEAYLPSADPEAPPFLSSVGPDAWTERMHESSAALGFSATQHHMGNVQISLQGDTAIMKCCLTAIGIDRTSSIVYATATYTDQVVRTAEGWRIARRRTQITSTFRLQSPPRSEVEAPIDTLNKVILQGGASA
jgi:3-phenylpropionate/cinnamic acid dioxygenase small subunit